jgi:glycosyltransferase involved in cell wall biosynthesis
MDIVSQAAKMYDGPGTDPFWKKGLLGTRDIIFKRLKAIGERNVVEYVVRFPRLPAVFGYLIRDFWTYAHVRGLLKEHYDVCVLADPLLAYVALRLKSLGKVKLLVYDDWDYFPGEYPEDPFWRHIIRYREHACVQSADGVVSVSSLLQELRRQQGARRTALVPNGVDYTLFETAQRKQPHPPTLLYMGSLGEAWGADLPILALPLIRRQIPDARYILVGAGPEEGRLRAMATQLGLEDCVQFRGTQKYRDLPRFLAEADIGVATCRDTDFRRYACPLKIVEYMAAGLPVIGTPVGETQRIIQKAKAGELVDFSPEAFASAVVDLISNRARFEAYSRNAVTFAQQHDWERLLEMEFAFVERLASEDRSGTRTPHSGNGNSTR